MHEATLRKWHRTLGIGLAIFVIVQAGSGALLSAEQLLGGHGDHVEPAAGELPQEMEVEVTEGLHYGGGPVGAAYRLLLGLGLTGMAGSGSVIYWQARGRLRRARRP
ncbi:MAG: hypothetical protein AB1634_01190 [Thermodesulfobacteriota bacterium]